MMKSLLISTFVFGTNYCGYIAPYIYCAKKAYPEYDILIHVDDQKNIDAIAPRLKLLEQAGITGFRVQAIAMPEGLSPKALSDKNVAMAVRWLHWDKAYDQYQGVYIGDIDLFICKEEMSLFEQHELHCQTLGLPISNIARPYSPRIGLRQMVSMTRRWGVYRALADLRKQTAGIPRLSGLHYFKPEQCGERIKAAIGAEIAFINSIYDGTNREYGVYSADNEFYLYDLYEKAGYSLPKPVKRSALELMGATDPAQEAFRPHHGLHLGMWRGADSRETMGADNNALIDSPVYQAYKEQFFALYDADPVLRQLLGDDTTLAGRVAGNMIRYYRKEV